MDKSKHLQNYSHINAQISIELFRNAKFKLNYQMKEKCYQNNKKKMEGKKERNVAIQNCRKQ